MNTKESFLRDFRNAMGWLNPRADSDHPKITPAASYQSMLERTDMWLTPRFFKDYRGEDFQNLGPEKASELAALVQQFRTLAERVPSNAPATKAEYNEGKTLMLKMFSILEGELKPLQ